MIKLQITFYTGSLMLETRDITERPDANAVYIAVHATQSADDDVAKLEQCQSTQCRQNERFRWQEGSAGSAKENILHYIQIHGTASQWSQ